MSLSSAPPAADIRQCDNVTDASITSLSQAPMSYSPLNHELSSELPGSIAPAPCTDKFRLLHVSDSTW
jgi:hypothetical protein